MVIPKISHMPPLSDGYYNIVEKKISPTRTYFSVDRHGLTGQIKGEFTNILPVCVGSPYTTIYVGPKNFVEIKF